MLPPEFAEAGDELLFSLQNRDRPTVVFLETNNPRTAANLRQFLANNLPEYRFYDIDLTPHLTTSLLRTLAQTLPTEVSNSQPVQYVVNVQGLENSLLVSRDGRIQDSDLTAQLNLERELLFRNVPYIIILWADTSFFRTLQREAPDFWSWVTYKFRFDSLENFEHRQQKEFVVHIRPVIRSVLNSILADVSDSIIQTIEQSALLYCQQYFGKELIARESSKEILVSRVRFAEKLTKEQAFIGLIRYGNSKQQVHGYNYIFLENYKILFAYLQRFPLHTSDLIYDIINDIFSEYFRSLRINEPKFELISTTLIKIARSEKLHKVRVKRENPLWLEDILKDLSVSSFEELIDKYHSDKYHSDKYRLDKYDSDEYDSDEYDLDEYDTDEYDSDEYDSDEYDTDEYDTDEYRLDKYYVEDQSFEENIILDAGISLGQLKQAIKWYTNKCYTKTGNEFNQGSIYYRIGRAYEKKNQPEMALAWSQQALNWKTKNGKKLTLGGFYHLIGMLYEAEGQLEMALAWFRQAIDWCTKTGNEFELGNTYHQIGMVYAEQQQWPQALASYRQAIDWKTKTGNEFALGNTYHQIGMVYEEQQQFEEAERWFEKAVDNLTHFDHPNLQTAIDSLNRVRDESARKAAE